MKVSVIIPTLNRAYCLGKAIDSALAQTAPVHEVVVVDGGSRDGTQELVEGYGPPVRCVGQSTRGLSAARNAGIAAATGDWVAVLDSDDWWLPDRIEKQQAGLLQDEGAVLGYCAYYLELSDGSRILKRRPSPEHLWPEFRLKNCVSNGSSVLVRKDALTALGGFDESLTAAEDWDMWVRLARRHKLSYVDEPLVVVTIGDANMSADPEVLIAGAEQILYKTLVADLSGREREFWARRNRSLTLFYAAMTVRNRGPAAARPYLLRSLRECPSPFFYKGRWLELAYNLLNTAIGQNRFGA